MILCIYQIDCNVGSKFHDDNFSKELTVYSTGSCTRKPLYTTNGNRFLVIVEASHASDLWTLESYSANFTVISRNQQTPKKKFQPYSINH
mmetsp:Transcript_82011/g.123153  ORF Transcript_82011/g.123153 Transcript_82011/m.123153 type:complete len:90 (-) Transcript_82011:496-765(-)